MKINFNFSKLIDNNKFIRLLSIILAIVIWFIVQIMIDPSKSAYISNIPVDFDLTDTTPGKNDLSIIEGIDQTVDVKVEGKGFKIGNLTASDFKAIPTLGTVTKPGEYEVIVTIKKVNENDSDYQITSKPITIRIKVDRLKELNVPILATAENINAEEGFYKENTYANFETIKLSGPELEINKIAKCVVSTEERAVISETSLFKGELFFYDKDNNELTFKYTKYAEETYQVTVLIYKRATVPLKVNFINVPQGFDLSKLKYTLSTPELEIAGAKNLIDDIKEITLDGEIDFRKIDIDYSAQLSISLVAGIKNIQNISSINIAFDKTNLESKLFTVSNIITKNESANLNVQVITKNIYNIKIVGNKTDLAKLTSNDIIAVIDLSNVSEGTSNVSVSVYATGNKFVWAVGEYSVLVSVKPK